MHKRFAPQRKHDLREKLQQYSGKSVGDVVKRPGSREEYEVVDFAYRVEKEVFVYWLRQTDSLRGGPVTHEGLQRWETVEGDSQDPEREVFHPGGNDTRMSRGWKEQLRSEFAKYVTKQVGDTVEPYYDDGHYEVVDLAYRFEEGEFVYWVEDDDGNIQMRDDLEMWDTVEK
ncbi:hypothetical protein J2752_001976 [Halarchaeum rubridurum]|uniref:Uncharacterized protein n=1 Tax=Halarchaeum rubridurum TaxID=489911 RepID=A0A830G0K6_9EURY|nr:hypothetical protein [Halarchaeum rubridurum]MBP1955064.1 hypothetical protein [Halarchaeum rubridurum]GGM69244.1 hypothetical protein GCM10009017_19300 [Halarchaeum rubridurum]